MDSRLTTPRSGMRTIRWHIPESLTGGETAMAGEIGIPRIRQTGPADPRVRRRIHGCDIRVYIRAGICIVSITAGRSVAACG